MYQVTETQKIQGRYNNPMQTITESTKEGNLS